MWQATRVNRLVGLAATLLPDGTALVTGGQTSGSTLGFTERYW